MLGVSNLYEFGIYALYEFGIYELSDPKKTFQIFALYFPCLKVVLEKNNDELSRKQQKGPVWFYSIHEFNYTFSTIYFYLVSRNM